MKKAPAKKNTLPKDLFVWSAIVLGILILIVIVEATFTLVNSYELSRLTTNLQKINQESTARLDEKSRRAQEALAEKARLEQMNSLPSDTVVIFTDPRTNLALRVPNDLGPENYAVEATQSSTSSESTAPPNISMLSVRREADGNVPECETVFYVEDATLLNFGDLSVVYRDTRYRVTTEKSCGVLLEKTPQN